MSYYDPDDHGKYKKGIAQIKRETWGDPIPPVICLPHQCDEWVIGGAEEVKLLIEDLQKLLVQLQSPDPLQKAGWDTHS
jgi:hypothetical protein